MAVGPIGIITFRRSPIEHYPPLRMRALLAEAALQEVDLRFFTATDCDPATGTVNASRWTNGDWTTEAIALPRLVLYGSHALTPEQKAMDAWIRSASRVVDYRARDKLKSAALMAASPWAGHVIPSERLDPEEAEAQLHRWLAGGGIVVKASDGMRGIGIRFVLPEDGRWTVACGTERWTGTAEEAVEQVLRSIRGRMSYRQYLVERYIGSRNALGQSVAIRVDVVRNPTGGWSLVRMTGRIAASGKLTSNGARGGAYMPIESFLADRRVRPAEELTEEAFALAAGAAEALTIGEPETATYECGIDLAIDPEDRLWFIEANPRPQAVWAQHERAMLVIAYLKALAST